MGADKESHKVILIANLPSLRVTSAALQQLSLSGHLRTYASVGRLLDSRFRITHHPVILVFNLLHRLAQKEVIRLDRFVSDHCEAIDVRKVASAGPFSVLQVASSLRSTRQLFVRKDRNPMTSSMLPCHGSEESASH